MAPVTVIQGNNKSKAIQKGHKGFKKGKSGNPKGRPKGSRNKATILSDVLNEDEANKLMRKCFELALDGNMTAMKICMDRLEAPKKTPQISFALPPITSAEDTVNAHGMVMQAVTAGDISIEIAKVLNDLIETSLKAIETHALVKEVDELKQQLEMMK